MKLFNKQINIFLLLWLLTGGAYSAVAGEESPSIAFSPFAAWKRLSFDGSGALAKVTTEIRLTAIAEMPDDLFEKTGGEAFDSSETGGNIKLIAVDTTVGYLSFFSERYTESLFFDAANGRAHRRIRQRNGNDPWIKAYYWMRQGVLRQKIQPANPDEKKQSPVSWTQRSQSVYPYPDPMGCPVISDSAVLFYMLSVLEPGGVRLPLKLCVFGKSQFHRLTIDGQSSFSTKVAFKIHSPSGDDTVETQLTPLVFSVSAEPVAPLPVTPEKFSLLGLEKDIRVFIDASRRLPIRVSGVTAELGNLVLHLRDAELE